MPTNFPTDFDTIGGTLGGTFVDAAPVVDPNVNVAAEFRNNTNDAVLAMQHRIGKTDDTNPASLSWATISVGGVGNLGLRFAQAQSEWPGEVAESGIFFKDGTLEPMFHREGEPKTTFHPLGGGGGASTLQDAYDGGNSIAMTPARNLVFQTEATSQFILTDSGATKLYMLADEPGGGLVLGDGATIKLALNGQIASNITFDGTAPRTISNAASPISISSIGLGGAVRLTADSALIGVDDAVGAIVRATNGNIDLETTGSAQDINIYALNAINIKTGGSFGQEMSLLTGSSDPTSSAPSGNRGSLYLRDSGAVGELYVKQDDGASVNWTLLGSGGGASDLQSAYVGGNTISMSVAEGNLTFVVDTAGADLVVHDGADDYLRTSGATKEISIGSANVKVNLPGDASTDITFDGTQPYSLTNSDDLAVISTTADLNLQGATSAELLATAGDVSMRTTDVNSDVTLLAGTTSGQVNINSDGAIFDAATKQASLNTAAFDANAVLTMKAIGVNNAKIMSLTNAEAVPSEAEFYVTGSDPDTAITATRGSLALRTDVAGVYVNTDGATAWSQLSTGGSTLQAIYDSSPSPATIATSGTKDFVVETGATSNFIVTDSSATEFYLVADEAAGELTLGAAAVDLNFDGDVASNITFDGTARSILNDGSGSLSILTEGADITVFAGASHDVVLHGDRRIILQAGSSELMFLLTGSDDPTSVAKDGTRGSLYLRDSGAVGELYVKQNDGTNTNWSLLSTGAVVSLQTAYNNGNVITTAGGNDFQVDGSENFVFTPSAASSYFQVDCNNTPNTNPFGAFHVLHSVGAVDNLKAVYVDSRNLAGNDNRSFGAHYAKIINASNYTTSLGNPPYILHGYEADLQLTGNVTGTDPVAGVAFYASNFNFSGTGTALSLGLFVDSSYDNFLVSYTGGALIQWGGMSDANLEQITYEADVVASGIQLASTSVIEHKYLMGLKGSRGTGYWTNVTDTGSGGDQKGGISHYISSTSGAPGALLAEGELISYYADHQTAAADSVGARHESLHIDYTFTSSGSGINDQGPSAFGVYVSMPESYLTVSGYHNNDGTFLFSRWAIYVEAGESQLRRTKFMGPNNLAKPLLEIQQLDPAEGFINYAGTEGINQSITYATTRQGTGTVVGPQQDAAGGLGWKFRGMVQVQVQGVSNKYYMPYYEWA